MSQETRPEDSRIVEDAIVIQRILHDMGVKSYEPEIIGELYGFMHNYACRVVKDAELLSKDANKDIIDVSDVSLAIEIAEGDVKSPLSRNAIMRLAEQRNKIPLAGCKTRNRLRLPPHRKCLMGINFVDIDAKLPTTTATETAQQPTMKSLDSPTDKPTTMKPLATPLVMPLQENMARSEKNLMKLVSVANNYKFICIGEETTKPPNEPSLQNRMQPGMENFHIGMVKRNAFD